MFPAGNFRLPDFVLIPVSCLFSQRCPEDRLWKGIVGISDFFKVNKKRGNREFQFQGRD